MLLLQANDVHVEVAVQLTADLTADDTLEKRLVFMSYIVNVSPHRGPVVGNTVQPVYCTVGGSSSK